MLHSPARRNAGLDDGAELQDPCGHDRAGPRGERPSRGGGWPGRVRPWRPVGTPAGAGRAEGREKQHAAGSEGGYQGGAGGRAAGGSPGDVGGRVREEPVLASCFTSSVTNPSVTTT